MKTLLLLRHGKSPKDIPHINDHDRPLKTKGIANSIKIGERLLEEKLVPDRVFSSTAKRACHTAELVYEHAKITGPLDLYKELYHAEPVTYLNVIRRYAGDESRCLMVGHNPGMEDLVFKLTKEIIALPTCGLAVIEIDIKQWQDVKTDSKAKLLHLWTPKEFED